MPNNLNAKGLAEQVVKAIKDSIPLDIMHTRSHTDAFTDSDAVNLITQAMAQREIEVWKAVLVETDKYDSHPTFVEWCQQRAAQPPTPGRSER